MRVFKINTFIQLECFLSIKSDMYDATNAVLLNFLSPKIPKKYNGFHKNIKKHNCFNVR